jgi:hypothetical protein
MTACTSFLRVRLLFGSLLVLSAVASTRLLADAPPGTQKPESRLLRSQAAELERAGHRLEAAAAYEKMAEARRILEGELKQAAPSRRKVTLYWQLADVNEKAGDHEGAERALKGAVESATGTPDEGAAQARFKKAKEKLQSL